ncbi:MAG: prephenate dehydratase [Endomicrobium sp.]|nr:prephenate dehydratase [Endomicrobium sp.]
MKNIKKNVSTARKDIDKVDREIVGLLNKRAKLALEVGKSKGKTGTVVYVPSREKEVMRNVFSASTKKGGIKNILGEEALENIYSEIISACRNVEAPTKVAFLGPWATFTHQAAMKKFGSSGFFVPCSTPFEVLKEVESGRTDFGAVPIENSNEGSVNATLDMLVDTDLLICGEISLKIEQCFLVKDPKVKPTKIYSHPHALAQCSAWLGKNYPDAQLVASASTAEAAKNASRDTSAAALASEAASKIYKLYVLEKGIQDSKQNYTRFLIIGKINAKPTGKDKTSLVFMGKDRVGMLYHLLGIFNRYKINLTRIESRPTKKKAWEYVFFADLEGHSLDKKVVSALEELKKNCVFMKVLGSYPKA